DELKLTNGTDGNQSAQAITSGSVDTAGGYAQPATGLRQVQATPTVATLDQELQGSLALAFNTTRAPLDDVRVRTALLLAYDPADYNTKVNDGLLPIADTWFTKKSAFYSKSIKQTTNDLAAAQKLIDAYVAEKGGPVKITILGSSTLAPNYTALQQQWSRLK